MEPVRHTVGWWLLLGLCSCGAPQVQASGALTVVNVSPSDGAADVPVDAAQGICFNQPVHADDVSADMLWITDDAGAKAPGLEVAAAGAEGACVRLAHPALQAGRAYVIHVEKGLRAAQGSATLPVAVDSRFKTAP